MLRLKLLKNYMEVKISMQLQNYITIISVANRGRNSLGHPKHAHSSARAISKYCRSEPVPKPLPHACPKCLKPRPNRHLPPSTLHLSKNSKWLHPTILKSGDERQMADTVDVITKYHGQYALYKWPSVYDLNMKMALREKRLDNPGLYYTG